jgi:hypothetical protein
MSATPQDFKTLPGAYWDLQGRLHSLRCVAQCIPLIETDNTDARRMAGQIDMANHLVSVVEDLVEIALKDAARMEVELSGGDAVVRWGDFRESASAAIAAMAPGQKLPSV